MLNDSAYGAFMKTPALNPILDFESSRPASFDNEETFIPPLIPKVCANANVPATRPNPKNNFFITLIFYSFNFINSNLLSLFDVSKLPNSLPKLIFRFKNE